ncbi:hypothetical protein GGF50DRAFT_114653 [Schizophyllum commune]
MGAQSTPSSSTSRTWTRRRCTLPNLEHLEVYGGYREVDFGVEGGEEGAESEFEFCELKGDWESPLLGEGSSSPLLEQGSESPSVAPQKGWGTSPARLVSASVSSSSPRTSSPPTSSPSPPRATRLKSLAIDILTSGVLVPYISGTVPVPSIGGTILRILNPPALTRLTMERILSAEHVRRVCGDIAGSYFPHTSHPALSLTSPSPSCFHYSSRPKPPSSVAHSPSSAAHSPSSNPLLTTLIHLTLAGDWSGTTIAARDLRALHACRSLEELELVWFVVRFGVGDMFNEHEFQEIDENGFQEIDENGFQEIDEEEIRAMGAAWPKLRRFAVREVGREQQVDREQEVGNSNEPQTDQAHPPRACSLGGLAAFARYFPALEELEISMDTRVVPVGASAEPFDTSAGPGGTSTGSGGTSADLLHPAPNLRSLNVGSSQVDAPPAFIAAFLTRCCPRLAPEALVSVGRRWDEVRRLMREENL